MSEDNGGRRGPERQGRSSHAAGTLSRALGGLIEPAARRRGFAAAAVLADWQLIVGPVLARRCQPVELNGRTGVLCLHASSVAALEIQHLVPQLIERINTYLGYRTVRRVRLVQAPLPPPRLPPEPPRLRSLHPEEEVAIGQAVGGVADDGLQAALLGLGRTLRASRG